MADDQLSGEVLAAITREMVRIKSESFGKGATEAKSYRCDDFLFCVLKGGITRVERTLPSLPPPAARAPGRLGPHSCPDERGHRRHEGVRRARPTKGRAYVRDDLVVVLLGETLTRAERTLMTDGKAERVLSVRQDFQRTMREALVSEVERLTDAA